LKNVIPFWDYFAINILTFSIAISISKSELGLYLEKVEIGDTVIMFYDSKLALFVPNNPDCPLCILEDGFINDDNGESFPSDAIININERTII